MASVSARWNRASGMSYIIGQSGDVLSLSTNSLPAPADPGSARTLASNADTMPTHDSFDRGKTVGISYFSSSIRADGQEHIADVGFTLSEAEMEVADLGLTLSIESRSADVLVKGIARHGTAYMDGRIREGDRILCINHVLCSGSDLDGVRGLLERSADGWVLLHVAPCFQGADNTSTFPVELAWRKRNPDIADLNSLEGSNEFGHSFQHIPRSSLLVLPAASAGVGLLIYRAEDTGSIYIEGMVKGGPAWRSNDVAEGDRIISVDGTKVIGMQSSEVMALIKGVSGCEVDIKLERRALAPSKALFKFHVRLTRAEIQEETFDEPLPFDNLPAQPFANGMRESNARLGGKAWFENGSAMLHEESAPHSSAGWFSSLGYRELGSPHGKPTAASEDHTPTAMLPPPSHQCDAEEVGQASNRRPPNIASGHSDGGLRFKHHHSSPQRDIQASDLSPGTLAIEASTLVPPLHSGTEPEFFLAGHHGHQHSNDTGNSNHSSPRHQSRHSRSSPVRAAILSRRGSQQSQQSRGGGGGGGGRKASFVSTDGRLSGVSLSPRGRSLLHGASSLLSDHASVGCSFDSAVHTDPGDHEPQHPLPLRPQSPPLDSYSAWITRPALAAHPVAFSPTRGRAFTLRGASSAFSTVTSGPAALRSQESSSSSPRSAARPLLFRALPASPHGWKCQHPQASPSAVSERNGPSDSPTEFVALSLQKEGACHTPSPLAEKAVTEITVCGDVVACSDCMYDLFFPDVALEPALTLFLSPAAPAVLFRF